MTYLLKEVDIEYSLFTIQDREMKVSHTIHVDAEVVTVKMEANQHDPVEYQFALNIADVDYLIEILKALRPRLEEANKNDSLKG